MALAVLLARYSGYDDIPIGSAVANRRNVEHKNVIGFFVNTVVMRIRARPEMTFKDLFGKQEVLNDGTVTVDENYIRESILYPQKRIVKGFGPVMPSSSESISFRAGAVASTRTAEFASQTEPPRR